MKKITLLLLFVSTMAFSQSKKPAKFYRNNWFDYISLKTNKFTYSKAGGVKNLQIIAINKTKYKIDGIEAIICYETNDENCYRTENIEIKNIPAYSSKSIAAPDSKGGRTIGIQIMGIGSKHMNFGYAPGNWAANSDDPYFIK